MIASAAMSFSAVSVIGTRTVVSVRPSSGYGADALAAGRISFTASGFYPLVNDLLAVAMDSILHHIGGVHQIGQARLDAEWILLSILQAVKTLRRYSSAVKNLPLLLALASACAAPAYELRPRAAISLAQGVKHGDGSLIGAQGVKLFDQWWQPAAGAPRAVLIVVHGLKDHSSRYGELANRLAEHGYAVRAFDLRGHGSSEGARVYVSDFDEYAQDLDAFVKLARIPGKPLFVLGHSMGGAIATDWVLTRKPQLDGLILSGAALRADVSGFTRAVTRFFGVVAPRLAVFSLDLDKFSRDPEVIAQCKADPLVDQGNGPARTAAQLLNAIGFIDDHMEEVTVPLLVMHGGADAITPPDGSRELMRRARSADKTLKIYDGLYHDLLHEPEKEQVMADVAAWMDARVKP
jgi:acylglycerol lipase